MTSDAKISMSESSPKAISASDPATSPSPTVTNTSSVFHAIVKYSRRTA